MRDYTGISYHIETDPARRNSLAQIDYFLRDLSRGISRIQNGQVPDGSGNSLGTLMDLPDYLFLPGRNGGQQLESVDGSATFRINQPINGATVIGTLGTVFESYRIASAAFADWAPYIFDGTTTDIAIKPYSTDGGLQVIPVDGTSGIRLVATASRAFIQCGRKDSGNLVQESALTVGGQGATVLKRLNTESESVAMSTSGSVGQNGALIPIRTARVGINLDPLDFSSSTVTTKGASLHISDIRRADVPTWPAATDPAPLIISNEGNVTNRVLLELRKVSAGTTPNMTLGTTTWTINSIGDIKWFNGATRLGRLRAYGDAGVETGTGGFQWLNGSDRLALAVLPATLGFNPNVNTNTIQSGNTTDDTFRTILCGNAGNKLDRLGLCATTVCQGDTTSGLIVLTSASNLHEWYSSAPALVASLSNTGILTVAGVTSTGTSSFVDNVFTVVDDGNNTRKLAFQCSGITAGNTRTMTVPDASGTLDLLGVTQTITGIKTYDIDTSAASNFILSGDWASLGGSGVGGVAFKDSVSGFTLTMQPSNTIASDVNLTLPTAGGALFTAATTVFLTNKTLSTATKLLWKSDGTVCINRDSVTSTKQMTMDLSGISASTTHIWTVANVPGLVGLIGAGADPPAAGAIGKPNITGKSGAQASTKLTDTTPAGYYVVHYTLEVTTGDVTAGTIQFQIGYTDDVGATTQTGTAIVLTATGRDRGAFEVYLASGNITYQTNLTGIAAASLYALRVRCEFMG